MSLPGALQGFPKPARASGGFRKLELPGRFPRRVGSLSEPGSFDIGRPRARNPSLRAASFAARPTRKTWSRRSCELVRIEAKLKEPRAGPAFARSFLSARSACPARQT